MLSARFVDLSARLLPCAPQPEAEAAEALKQRLGQLQVAAAEWPELELRAAELGRAAEEVEALKAQVCVGVGVGACVGRDMA